MTGLNQFRTTAAPSDAMQYILLVPYNAATAAIIDDVRASSHFTSDHLTALSEVPNNYFPIHDDAAFIYPGDEETVATYQWVDRTAASNPELMVQVLSTVEDNKITTENLFLQFGHGFKGILIYKKHSDESAVLIGFDGELNPVRDALGARSCCLNLWSSGNMLKVDDADMLAEMQHVLDDALNVCGDASHSLNARKLPRLAL